MMKRFALFAAMVLGWAVAHGADSEAQVERILHLPAPPAGVVFEIVNGDEAALQWALPAVRQLSLRLRARFPALPIAVVSHGKEEFALLQENQARYPQVHAAVRQLSEADGIPLHVCGTHAGWRNKAKEDFPAYVDVAPAGPAQIRDYVALGYLQVVVDQPADDRTER